MFCKEKQDRLHEPDGDAPVLLTFFPQAALVLVFISSTDSYVFPWSGSSGICSQLLWLLLVLLGLWRSSE